MYMRTQIALLRSRPVLQSALKDEKVRQLPLVLKQSNPVEWLEKELTVDQLPNTEIVRVSLAARGAGGDLAPVVNAVVAAYLREVVRAEDDAQKGQLSALQMAYGNAEEKLRQLQQTFQDLTRTFKGGDSKILTLRQQALVDDHSTAKREIAAANTRLRELELKIAAYRLELEPAVASVRIQLPFRQFATAHLPCPFLARDRHAADLVLDHDLGSDPRAVVLETEVAKLRDQLRQYEERAADPNSPFKAEMKRRLESAEAALQAAHNERRTAAAARHRRTAGASAGRLLREAETERLAIERQRAVLQDEAAAVKKELDSLGIGSVELELKRAEVARQEQFLQTVWEQKERLEVESKAAKAEMRRRVAVASDAEEASVLNKNGRAQEAAGAGLAGMAAVLLAIALVDLRRNRIHAPVDVSRGLRLRVVGALPKVPGNATGISRGEGKYGFVEAIDGLRTTLLTMPQTGGGAKGMVVLMASSVSGEGKTTLATQLAASLARSRRRTLLVDCDLRSPSLHQLFGLRPGPGVCELLSGSAALGDVVRPTGTDDLHLLSAGELTRAAEAGLAQAAVVRRVVDELRARYDAVVIDSSPVLLVPDVLMVAGCVDGILLSVRPGVSEAGEVYAAYERLSAHQLPFLGVVVNGVFQRQTYAQKGGYGRPVTSEPAAV